MLIDFLQFLANYVLAGFVIGYLHMKLADKQSPFAPAVAFIK